MTICKCCNKDKPDTEFVSDKGQGKNGNYKWCEHCRWVKFQSPEAKAKKKANLLKAKQRKEALNND